MTAGEFVSLRSNPENQHKSSLINNAKNIPNKTTMNKNIKNTDTKINNPIDISVIVPVYNVEEYLPACIDSLLHQGEVHLEIILIDDGSTDNSGAIADQYAKQDSRIKVIHQENRGLSCARNTGIDESRGKYIAFVDSDDWIMENSLCQLYQIAVENQCDIVKGDFQYNQQDRNVKSPFNPVPKELLNTVLSGNECFCGLVKSRAFVPMVWSYLYRRDYIEQIKMRFEEGIIHEDELWTPLVLCQALRIVIIDLVFYYYRQREDSIMESSNTQIRLNSLLHVANRLMEFASQFDFAVLSGELKNLLYVHIFYLYTRAFKYQRFFVYASRTPFR